MVLVLEDELRLRVVRAEHGSAVVVDQRRLHVVARLGAFHLLQNERQRSLLGWNSSCTDFRRRQNSIFGLLVDRKVICYPHFFDLSSIVVDFNFGFDLFLLVKDIQDIFVPYLRSYYVFCIY